MIKKEYQNENQSKNKNKANFLYKMHQQETGSDTPKKSSFRVRFIQWLKQLPLDERYLAVKVHAPGLARKIQQVMIEFQSEAQQHAKKDQFSLKKISPRQLKQIIQSIVFISDGEEFFDNVGFDFTYIEFPDKLYELLISTFSQQQKLMFLTQHYQIESQNLDDVIAIVNKAQSKEELIIILLAFLRAEIFLKYEQKKPINLQQQRNRKKQFSMFWRNLSEQYKRKILLLNKDTFQSLSNYLMQRKIHLSAEDLERQFNEMMQMEKNQFCNKIFKCKLKKSLTYFTDYHELIYKQWKTELNKKKRKPKHYKNHHTEKNSSSLNRISINNQRPIKRPLQKYEKQQQKSEFIIIKQKIKPISSNSVQNQKNIKPTLIINASEKQYKNISQVLIVKNETQKIPKSQVSNSNISAVSQNNQPVSAGQGKRKRNRNNRRKKSVSAQSKETNTTNHKFEKQQKYLYEGKLEEQKPRSSNQLINNQRFTFEQQERQFLCPYLSKEQQQKDAAQQQLQFDRLKNQIQKPTIDLIDIPEIDYHSEIVNLLNSQIQEYSDLINEEANEFYDRRLIAYERIQFILGMWKIPIKLFGSCASGITIKNSDIDIAVDNSILNYFMHLAESSRLRGALEQLQQLLIQQPWVTSLRLIKTAAIPLIKLKANTEINFTQIPGFEIYPAYLDILNRPHSSAGQIHIDLTIQTMNKEQQCNHLGIISTDQINNWIKQIKSLHPIVIMIKSYLTKMNLNITYEGGLNTYSMICMLVAFIKYRHLQQETDVVKVFQMILKFYGFQFDQKLQGIDLLNDQIFYDKLALKPSKSADTQEQQIKTPELTLSQSAPAFSQADLEIKDPLNNGKIMTRNCYSFPKIRQVFQTIYQKCFTQQEAKLQKIFKEQFRNRYFQTSNKETQKQDQKTIELLLQECKQKLSNPMVTLFQ